MVWAVTFRSFRRTAFSLGLCLLAFGFAMEAKLACYCHAENFGDDIVSAKALPADLPEIVSHGVQVHKLAHPQLLVVFWAALTTATLRSADCLLVRSSASNRLSVASAIYFSPNLFFRPPPVL
jgi:hypothetical protein